MSVPLLILPEMSKRAKIEDALASTGEYRSIVTMSRLGAGLRYLEVTADDSIVVLPTAFGFPAIESFMQEATDLKRQRHLCYMFVVEPKERATDVIVDSLILGAHGLLCEPFSSDYIAKAISMAMILGREGSYKNLEITKHIVADALSRMFSLNKFNQDGLLCKLMRYIERKPHQCDSC